MIPHQAIALGATLGVVLIASVVYARWRAAQRRRAQRNTRVVRAALHVPPPPPNVKVQSPDSTAEFVNRMQFFAEESVMPPAARVPPPPVPTSADPWGDDEPTVFREPRGKV